MPDAQVNLLDTYRAEAATKPDSAEARANLGWGYYGEKQFVEAIKEFGEALRLEAGNVDAHYGLGLALKESGATQEAIPEFEAVMRLAPSLEAKVRGRMLARMAHGHINQITKGNWDLDRELRQHES